jgi:MFS family permease
MNKTKSFALGYSYVGLSFLFYVLFAVFTSTGLSTLIGFLCAKTGLTPGVLTVYNTPGALIGVGFVYFTAKIVRKTGTKPLICIGVFLTAVAAFLWSVCTTNATYFVLMILSQVGYALYGTAGSSILITNWFPRTKGFIMGITTAGIMASTFTYIAFITAFEPVMGFDLIMRGTALFLLILSISCWFWIKDKPEDVGLLPDNKPIDLVADKPDVAAAESDSGAWTNRQLLFSRQGILFILVFGFATLVARGDAVGKIPFMVELGFERMTAVWIVSVCALVSIAGSVIIGWLDTKLGTKKAVIIFSIIYSGSFFATYFATPINPVLTVVVNSFSYFAQGACANLLYSMLGTSYGRKHYAQAVGVLTTICSLVIAFSYFAVGRVLTMFGAYRPTKLLFGVIMLIVLPLCFLLKDGYIPAPNEKKDQSQK